MREAVSRRGVRRGGARAAPSRLLMRFQGFRTNGVDKPLWPGRRLSEAPPPCNAGWWDAVVLAP
jgi:hypothetical protein